MKVISLNRAEVLAELHRIAAHLQAEHPEVTDVRLFGSLARGDQTGISDADILIVLRDTDETDPHRRILAFMPYFALKRGVDLLVFTRAEIERRLSENDHFARRLWEESISLISAPT